MAKSDTPARDAVLVKYLNEAYGKETQLETALQAQIGLAERPTLKKGLQEHLKVTKAQSRALKSRIRALGGKAESADVVTSTANKALAVAKGPVQALRGTSDADNELRNIRDCYWNEAEEIAHYALIESLAEELKDTETAKLARQHRRDEEKMQKLLEREMAKVVKEVIKTEVPKEERPSPRRSSSRSSNSRSNGSRSNGSSRSRSGGTARSTTRGRKRAAPAG